MSYTVKVYIFQCDTDSHFRVVENGVWKYANGGTWGYSGGGMVLTMGGSGTSGILRFKSGGDESFVVTCGIHNYKPWVDIVTNLSNEQTGVSILPEYYNNEVPARVKAREAQRDKYSVKNQVGRTITANYKSQEGNNLELDLVIGSK